VLIQLALGAIYAWSVFTPKLVEAGWSKAQTQGVFSTGLFFFAIVMVIAGRIMPKIGPRKLAISGGFVLGSGYLLAGLFGGTSFISLLIFIGMIGGAGIGLAYVVPIAVGMKWFPDKKGLITGLAVAGFGFGATLWVKLAGSWGDLIGLYGLSTTFTALGAIFMLMILLGGIWMVYPPEGWLPAGYSVPVAADGSAVGDKNDFLNLSGFLIEYMGLDNDKPLSLIPLGYHGRPGRFTFPWLGSCLGYAIPEEKNIHEVSISKLSKTIMSVKNLSKLPLKADSEGYDFFKTLKRYLI